MIVLALKKSGPICFAFLETKEIMEDILELIISWLQSITEFDISGYVLIFKWILVLASVVMESLSLEKSFGKLSQYQQDPIHVVEDIEGNKHVFEADVEKYKITTYCFLGLFIVDLLISVILLLHETYRSCHDRENNDRENNGRENNDRAEVKSCCSVISKILLDFFIKIPLLSVTMLAIRFEGVVVFREHFFYLLMVLSLFFFTTIHLLLDIWPLKTKKWKKFFYFLLAVPLVCLMYSLVTFQIIFLNPTSPTRFPELVDKYGGIFSKTFWHPDRDYQLLLFQYATENLNPLDTTTYRMLYLFHITLWIGYIFVFGLLCLIAIVIVISILCCCIYIGWKVLVKS